MKELFKYINERKLEMLKESEAANKQAQVLTAQLQMARNKLAELEIELKVLGALEAKFKLKEG